MDRSTVITSSNRRRLIIGTSLVLLLLIVFSFRPSFKNQDAWTAPVAQGDSKGHQDPDTRPLVAEETIKVPTHVILYPVASHTGQAAASSAVPTSKHTTVATKGACDGFPHTKDILVVMKTGATEAYNKLPIHFLTTLKCAEDVVLFSDMEMEMGGHHLIDVLRDVKEDVKKDNNDFKLYDLLQQYRSLGEDPRPLSSNGNGWNLDKYKFTHLLLKTWNHRKDADWYVFMEADTGIVWDNLRYFLDHFFKPTDPLYIGSPTYLDIEFAHGGTGYIISNAAMKKAVGGHPDIADRYDNDVKGICCGDRMIARVMLDENIKLTKAWPMLNGEKPLTLPFGKEHWCQPIITMHHMTAQEVSQVWTFEQERKAQGITSPLIMKDLFDKFVRGNMRSHREDWNNLSNSKVYQHGAKEVNGKKWEELSAAERASAESPEKCKDLCDSDAECFQWNHQDQTCSLGRTFILGGSASPEDNKRSFSGWNLDRFAAFEQKMKNCSSGPNWHIRGI